jgi:hypothetical protein
MSNTWCLTLPELKRISLNGQALSSGINRNYWSATTVSNNPANAWNTNLSNGNTNNNTKVSNQNYVRCVRSEMGIRVMGLSRIFFIKSSLILNEINSRG